MRSSYSGRVIGPKMSTCTLPRMFMPAPWITRTLGITLSVRTGMAGILPDGECKVWRRASSMARLDGKVAAVTGGASGIGEATVRRFVTEGAKVAFADRDAERGKRVAAEIAASGGEAVFVEAHMQRETEAAAFVRQAAERFGRLDILVNNAGVRLYHTVEDATAESWDEILGVNLKGYAFCAKAAIPFLRQAAPSSIVNVASVRSVTSIGKTTQYDT